MKTESQLSRIVVFDNYEIKEMAKGIVVLSTIVGEDSLNYYGNAHGGYLFTLCDQVSGLVVLTTGYDAVTIQSNINYLKAAKCSDALLVKGLILHDGRSTKVVEVVITTIDHQLVAKGTFTMFVTGKREQEFVLKEGEA